MLRTGLEHIYFVVLYDDFGLNNFQALVAEAVGEVVIDIGAIIPLHQWVV